MPGKPTQVEPIVDAGTTLCLLVRGAWPGNETAFFTSPEIPLQVGRVVRAAGSDVAAHKHPHEPRTIAATTEVLIVQQGRTHLDLFDDHGKKVATRELRAGDIAILLAGGHALRAIEDIVLVEVKQGPYRGSADKEFI